jgi:hypothetical protein
MNGGGQSSVYTSLDPHLQLLERLARTRKFTNETSQFYEARNPLVTLSTYFSIAPDWLLICSYLGGFAAARR